MGGHVGGFVGGVCADLSRSGFARPAPARSDPVRPGEGFTGRPTEVYKWLPWLQPPGSTAAAKKQPAILDVEEFLPPHALDSRSRAERE